MQHSLEDCLYRIIRDRSLSVLFQPIVANKQRAIYGYEALIRGPSNTPLHSPATLFETASRYGRLVELEVLCREVSIQQFVHLNLPGKLFLNTSPESLFEPNFRTGSTLEILRHAGLSPERVVIELTEQFPTENYEAIREAKHHYKSMGFEIAIDDLGAGYAGLRMWSELRPDYVKIDQVSGNAGAAAEASGEADQDAVDSVRVVEATRSGVEQLSQEMEQAHQQINKLSRDSSEIENILRVIQEIAEQTNLLALNAAIEAARAGEVGRGFAVVADEVRTLSKRTHDSVHMVQATINKIQTRIVTVVDAIDRSQAQMQNTVQQTGSTEASLKRIAGGITTISRMNSGILEAVTEEQSAAARIQDDARDISSFADQTLDQARRTVATGERLSELSSELRNLVSGFKTEESGPAATNSGTLVTLLPPAPADGEKRAFRDDSDEEISRLSA